MAVVRTGKPAGEAQVSSAGAGAAEEAEEEVVLAQFDDETVTDGDLRRFLAGFVIERWSDNESNRGYLLNVVVSERLAAHAARHVELDADEQRLPPVARRKLKLRRWVEERAREEGWDVADPRAYRDRLRDAAKVQRGETPVTEFQDALNSASLDVRAGYESLINAYRSVPARLQEPANGEFRFGVYDADCLGFIDSATASIDGRCDCSALNERLMWEDGLYFDVALSGLGPNVLGRFNVITPRCHERIVIADNAMQREAKWEDLKKEFDGWSSQVRIVELTADGADPGRLELILETMKGKVASCTLDMGLTSLDSRIAVTFRLSPSGAMDDFKLEDLAGTATGPCLEDTFATLKFPNTTVRTVPVKAVLQLTARKE